MNDNRVMPNFEREIVSESKHCLLSDHGLFNNNIININKLFKSEPEPPCGLIVA